MKKKPAKRRPWTADYPLLHSFKFALPEWRSALKNLKKAFAAAELSAAQSLTKKLRAQRGEAATKDRSISRQDARAPSLLEQRHKICAGCEDFQAY
jgi:hypothetical protein